MRAGKIARRQQHKRIELKLQMIFVPAALLRAAIAECYLCNMPPKKAKAPVNGRVVRCALEGFG